MLKNTHTLQLWFSGLQAFCDFLIEWCSAENSLRNLAVRTLAPPAPYVAILPDYMMAVQELHMTQEGMHTESICLQCKSKGVEPVVTSVLHQLSGNPSCGVHFFCPNCHSVPDRVALDEMPLCPVLWKVWQSLQKIPPDAAPLLYREIDFETMEKVSNKLQRGKSCCADGIPREYCKDATVLFRERYRAAFNALIRGQQTHAHEWLAGIVALVPKILGALCHY